MNGPLARLALTIASLTMAVGPIGCANWSTKRVYGEVIELDREPVGQPHYVRTTSAELGVGIDAPRDRRGRRARGRAGARFDSVERTVCVQQTQVEYARPYTDVVRARRTGDIVGSVILMGLGAITLGTTAFVDALATSTSSSFDSSDPDFSGGYLVGGAAVGSGLLWMGLSFALLPAGPRPPDLEGEELSTTVELTEVTGCTEPGAPPALPDTAARLRELERLRDIGAITEEEYQDARQEIIGDL